MAKFKLDLSDEALAKMGAVQLIVGLTEEVKSVVQRFPDLREEARKLFIEALLVPTAKVRGAKAKTVEEATEMAKSRPRRRVVRTTSVKGSAAKRRNGEGGRAKDSTTPPLGKLKPLVMTEVPRLLAAAPGLTKVEMAERIYNIAKAKGIKTTLGSVKQNVYANAGHLWEKKTKK